MGGAAGPLQSVGQLIQRSASPLGYFVRREDTFRTGRCLYHHLKKRWLPMVTVGVRLQTQELRPTLAGAKNPVAPKLGSQPAKASATASFAVWLAAIWMVPFNTGSY